MSACASARTGLFWHCEKTNGNGQKMNGYEIYVFVLCLIVFALLTAVFSVLIASLVKASIRLIAGGLEDKRILAEYEKSNKQKKKTGWFERLISVLFSVVKQIESAGCYSMITAGLPVMKSHQHRLTFSLLPFMTS